MIGPRRIPLFLWAAALLAGLLPGCEGGGTSSETVGVRPGTVELRTGPSGMTGRTDAGSKVGLYSAGYLPHLDSGFKVATVAGSDGAFAFTGLAPGRYNVVVTRPTDGKAAFLPGLTLPGSDSARSGLDSTGTLRGLITDSTRIFGARVHIPGSPFFTTADTAAFYVLSGLPPAEYRVFKTWNRLLPCDTAVCGGIERLRDSTSALIRAGGKTDW